MLSAMVNQIIFVKIWYGDYSFNYIHPISVASLRLIIGAIVLLIYFKVKKIKFYLTFKNMIIIFFIGFIGNFIPFSLISWSEIYIQSNTAGLLLSVAPILTLIFSLHLNL